MLTITINGTVNYKWSCSIAMLNYQRVNIVNIHRSTMSPLNYGGLWPKRAQWAMRCGGFRLVMGVPEIIQVRKQENQPCIIKSHGDLGIPHDLRNLHVPLCFLLSLKLKIGWTTWRSCASPFTKQELGDLMRSQHYKKKQKAKQNPIPNPILKSLRCHDISFTTSIVLYSWQEITYSTYIHYHDTHIPYAD